MNYKFYHKTTGVPVVPTAILSLGKEDYREAFVGRHSDPRLFIAVTPEGLVVLMRHDNQQYTLITTSEVAHG